MIKRKRYLFFSILLVLSLFVRYNCYAQKDSLYIGKYDEKLSVRTFISQMFTVLTYEDESNNRVDYKPNSPLNIGLGFSYKRIGFNASYGVNLSSNKNKGKTKALELQYHYYGRKIMFDLFLHNYSGFYIDEDNRKSDIYVHRPDIKLRQLGFFGQYVFNGDKFSYKAAFDQNEIQKLSAGSFQVGVGLYYNRIRADSTLSLNTSLQSQTSIDNVQLGVSAGYAHTWIMKRFHITVAVALGCNFGVLDINHYKSNGLDVYPSFFPRFAAGYNAKKWSINVQAFTNILYTSLAKESSMSLSTGTGQLTFIKRF